VKNKLKGAIILANRNKLLVPGIEKALNEFKFEIAQEFGVQLSANSTSRQNGSVGGEITKRLVQQAEQEDQAKQ
jgi:small acid-soluble spore protein D (minor alpha/beta-type SASP)